jgi:hypothetical protein
MQNAECRIQTLTRVNTTNTLRRETIDHWIRTNQFYEPHPLVMCLGDAFGEAPRSMHANGVLFENRATRRIRFGIRVRTPGARASGRGLVQAPVLSPRFFLALP